MSTYHADMNARSTRPVHGAHRNLIIGSEYPLLLSCSINGISSPSKTYESPLPVPAEDDPWTLAGAIRRGERRLQEVHSTASIKSLIDQTRPPTPAA
jgi:hypothetical protein